MSSASRSAPSASSALARGRAHLLESSAYWLSTMLPFGRPRSRCLASVISSACASGNAAGTRSPWCLAPVRADSAVTMSLIGSISLLGRLDPGQLDPGQLDPGQSDAVRHDAGQFDPGQSDPG